MGSYHIIDGEKVSVRYNGQEWTCASCHQYQRKCAGAAMVRECIADRVRLSTHMKELWEKIRYQLDNDSFNEVYDASEFEVQVGRKKHKN